MQLKAVCSSEMSTQTLKINGRITQKTTFIFRKGQWKVVKVGDYCWTDKELVITVGHTKNW
jgi:hypothetical protein